MWPNRDHSIVYTTQWFNNKLTTIKQKTGKLVSNVQVGDSPSHVMTLPDTDDITVAINGENDIVIIPAGTTKVNYALLIQNHGQAPGNPHGRWISADGKRIITPNINTHDAGFYDVEDGKIVARTATGEGQPGAHPIAIGMLAGFQQGIRGQFAASQRQRHGWRGQLYQEHQSDRTLQSDYR